MKTLLFILVFCCFAFISLSQTRQGAEMSQERCKQITEYYCKQFIIDEVLKIPDRQSVGVHINAITASKSGEITTVLYNCHSLNKKGVVIAFWNDYSTGINLPYKGYGFYALGFEQAKELFDNLESLMVQENQILSNDIGNLAYKSDDLTFLFYNNIGEFGPNDAIRVWWKSFDSDWNQTNLRTTIKRFKKFFGLAK